MGHSLAPGDLLTATARRVRLLYQNDLWWGRLRGPRTHAWTSEEPPALRSGAVSGRCGERVLNFLCCPRLAGGAPYNRLAFEYLEAGREVAMVTKTRSVSKSSVPRTASPGTSPYRFLVGNDPNPDVLLTSLRSAGYSLVWKKEPR